MDWNGIYNETLMLTSDYWFTVFYNNPNTKEKETFKSHFTFKKVNKKSKTYFFN